MVITLRKCDSSLLKICLSTNPYTWDLKTVTLLILNFARISKVNLFFEIFTNVSIIFNISGNMIFSLLFQRDFFYFLLIIIFSLLFHFFSLHFLFQFYVSFTMYFFHFLVFSLFYFTLFNLVLPFIFNITSSKESYNVRNIYLHMTLRWKFS